MAPTAGDSGLKRTAPTHAAVVAACFAVHGGLHLWQGRAYDLVWACNVAAPLLAVGCALGLRPLVAVPTLWLCFGTPLWLLDLATGGTMTITSPLIHLLCPVVGVLAARRIGWSAPSWPWATAALGALMALTRWITPAEHNVNLAFRVWAGWERTFPSYPVYVGVLLLACAATFFAAERLLLRFAVDAAAQSSA